MTALQQGLSSPLAQDSGGSEQDALITNIDELSRLRGFSRTAP